jgi:signal peptidase II
MAKLGKIEDRRRVALPALITIVSAAALVGLDLWTKGLAAAYLSGRGTVRVLGDFAVLIFVRNRGAFLSLGAGLPPALSFACLVVLPLAAFAALAAFLLFRGRGSRRAADGPSPGPGTAELAALALILAGGAGNLVDRILFGQVRDFLNFGIGRLRTGIMNLADLYILAALIVALVEGLSRRARRD